MFTSSEYFDMLLLYGQCDESATVAAQGPILEITGKYSFENIFP
jgi:hypothetical protein